MLAIENLESGYGSMQVLWGPSLEVAQGSITSLLGPNGVGKSTLLWSVMGSVKPTRGAIRYKGEEVTRLPAHRKVELGLTLVPEGRHLFGEMNILENLRMGAYTKRARARTDESLDLVFGLFPRLRERSSQQAGSLSGGEQQMLTIARSLMTGPELIMLDEPSQGLAPKLAWEVFETIQRLRSEVGLTILLVEQNVEASIKSADYVYVMHEGVIKVHGPVAEIADSPEIREAYLGI